MNMKQASKYLGISKTKMTKLVATGVIICESNPLDDRVRLVKVSDLDKLKEFQTGGKKQQPKTARE